MICPATLLSTSKHSSPETGLDRYFFNKRLICLAVGFQSADFYDRRVQRFQ